MNSKRLWATTATIFSLSVFGPRSSGVWAQSKQAVCPAGWEWVRFILNLPIPKKPACSFVDAHIRIVFLCRTRISLGKIHVLSVPCWTPPVVVPVSVQAVIAVTGPFDSMYFRTLHGSSGERHAEL